MLEELCEIIEAGYEQKALQRSPHLTLLNEEWYVSEMKPVMARWMLLWLEANHVSGLRPDHMEAYVTRDCAPIAHEQWDEKVEAAAARREVEMAEEAGRRAYQPPCKGSAAHAQLRCDLPRSPVA